MKNKILDYLIVAVLISISLVFFIPVILIISLLTYIASIPSRIGQRVSIEDWVYIALSKLLDFDQMRQFRDDIFHRMRPHLKVEEELDRWWILREMESAIDHTNRTLQSGEYAIVFFLGVGSIFIDRSIQGIPISILLTIPAIILSWIVIIRIVATRIVVYKPELYIEEPTNDLAVRMAFNKGPIFKGSSVAILLLSILVGMNGGLGYQEGLEYIEKAVAMTHPDDGKRWEVSE